MHHFAGHYRTIFHAYVFAEILLHHPVVWVQYAYNACADFSPSDFLTPAPTVDNSPRVLSMLQRNGKQKHGTWFFTDADDVDSSGVW